MIKGSGLIKIKILDLSFSDLDNHFKYQVYRALTSESMRTFQKNIIKVVNLNATRDSRVRNDESPSLINHTPIVNLCITLCCQDTVFWIILQNAVWEPFCLLTNWSEMSAKRPLCKGFVEVNPRIWWSLLWSHTNKQNFVSVIPLLEDIARSTCSSINWNWSIITDEMSWDVINLQNHRTSASQHVTQRPLIDWSE